MTDINRKFFGIVSPNGCWHDYLKHIDTRQHRPVWYVCKICRGYSPDGEHPTYAHSDIIADAMRGASLWGEFKMWAWNYFDTGDDPQWDEKILDCFAWADLLKAAIIAWRETTHTWTGEKWEVKRED
jgi:hypothetical protein